MRCAVCSESLVKPVYESASSTAITSMTQLTNMRTRVWLCGHCGHLTSDPLPDNQSFYEFDYQISLGSEDEDQVYEVVGGRVIYRHEHQVKVFKEKVDIPSLERVLDFGCAKATMMRTLKQENTGAAIHLFDVSRDYEQYWSAIAPQENWAVHELPSAWNGTFDLVTSFFSLEHIPDPQAALRDIAALLRVGGTFYCVVPYTLTNIADLLVVDHVNHFTSSSMRHLLAHAGFDQITLDTISHRGALVVTAVNAGSPARPNDLAPDKAEQRAAEDLAAYWTNAQRTVLSGETLAASQPSAIYGAGFYGVYVHTTLADSDRVTCFIDRNPFLQGKTILGKPVIDPETLDQTISTIYFGLNPSVAKHVVPEFLSAHPHVRHSVVLDLFEV